MCNFDFQVVLECKASITLNTLRFIRKNEAQKQYKIPIGKLSSQNDFKIINYCLK